MPATDGSMSRSWLAEECRQQAVLFLAVAAFSRGEKTGAVATGCPEPLLAGGSFLRSLVTSRAGVLDAGIRASEVAAWVDRAFDQHAAQADAGIPLTPWKRAELVRWWLEAGKTLAPIDVAQRAMLGRVTRGGNDAMHPALWCAERFDRFSLSMDAFGEESEESPRKDDWNTAAKAGDDCRQKLFNWVMLPERRRPGLGTDLKTWLSHLQGEMRDIVDDAAALFGTNRRFRSGGELSLETSDKWVARWTAESHSGGRVFTEIRRPVIYPTANGTGQLVKGVAVMPYAQSLVAELADLRAADVPGGATLAGNLPSLERATAFALACWQPNDPVSKFWGKAGDAGPGLLPPETVEPAFLAVARWLTAAQVVADLDGSSALREEPGELIDAIRIALALERFRVRESRTGQRPGRAIPLVAGVPDLQHCLVFTHEKSAFEVPLGYLDEPASCSPSLFAAIEALDWRLWAFTAAPWDREEELTRAELGILLRPQVLRSDAWESIKRQALHVSGGAADEESLAKLFTYAHERRMAFELFRNRVYRDKPAGAMLDGLIQECRDLAQESLVALVRLDPAAVRRLDPPRQTNGAIDVATWLARGGPAGDAADDTAAEPVIPYRLHWSRGPRPRGELLEEWRDGNVVKVLVSAGDATDTELAVLNAPGLAANWRDVRPDAPAGRLAKLLADCKARLAGSGAGESDPSVPPLVGLRTAFAGEAAAAFHELIARCRAGDEAALAWWRVLKGDQGFDFACHPGIDIEARGLQPPALDEPFLDWDFDGTVPAGQDLEVRFAMTPAKARRVISLGPRKSGSLADRAELLATACQRAGGSLTRLGNEARLATHRWLTFGALAPHPVGTVEPLLDELLHGEAAPAADRTAIFAAVAEWCEVIDHQLVPVAWRAEARLLPAAFADLTLAPDFDDQAPTGTVVVRRFGLRGVYGWPFSGAVSAGPAPGGFHEFRACAERLGNSQDVGHNPSGYDLLCRADELAKHALAGTLPLALPNLFDRLWEAIASVTDPAARAELELAATPLFEMLKGCCRMIPFEPVKMGEYSAGWVREADGTQPKGRRIKRLVRPGLRTVENVLVRPALVITE
jgi:hypothetical protein